MKVKNKRILAHLLLSLAVLLLAFPLLFALIKSTQSTGQVLSSRMMPGTQFLKNLGNVWWNYRFYRYMITSLEVALAIMLGKTLLSFFAAFALVFLQFRGKAFLFGFILVTLMMPTEVMVVGLFDLVSLQPPSDTVELLSWLFNPKSFLLEPLPYGFGWTNRTLSIILPFLASATGVFLFRQHFRNIPSSLCDAARIDGAGPIRFIYHVLFPLSRNTIGALFVVQFIYAWNQYLWPRIIIRDESAQVVQVGLKVLIGNSEGVMWGEVMAGTVLTMIPPLFILYLLHDQLMKGIALGGISRAPASQGSDKVLVPQEEEPLPEEEFPQGETVAHKGYQEDRSQGLQVVGVGEENPPLVQITRPKGDVIADLGEEEREGEGQDGGQEDH